MKFKLLFLAVSLTFSLSAQEKKELKEIREEKRVIVLQENENGKDYKVKIENDDVTSIQLNGVEVPKKDYAKHQQVIDRMKANLPKEFTAAMNGEITGEPKRMGEAESEQTIKITKNADGQTVIKVTPSSLDEKAFEFVITGASSITMNGEPLKEGEIRIKNIERIFKEIDEPQKGEKIIIKKQ